MAREQNLQINVMLEVGTIVSNATTFCYVDTLGWKYAKIHVINESATATNSSSTWTTCSLMHGDTTAVSSHTAIHTGTTGTSPGTTQYTFPINNNASTPMVVSFLGKLDDTERYLGISLQAADSTHNTCVVLAKLTRGDSVLMANEGWFGGTHVQDSDDATTLTTRNSVLTIFP